MKFNMSNIQLVIIVNITYISIFVYCLWRYVHYYNIKWMYYWYNQKLKLNELTIHTSCLSYADCRYLIATNYIFKNDKL